MFIREKLKSRPWMVGYFKEKLAEVWPDTQNGGNGFFYEKL